MLTYLMKSSPGIIFKTLACVVKCLIWLGCLEQIRGYPIDKYYYLHDMTCRYCVYTEYE